MAQPNGIGCRRVLRPTFLISPSRGVGSQLQGNSARHAVKPVPQRIIDPKSLGLSRQEQERRLEGVVARRWGQRLRPGTRPSPWPHGAAPSSRTPDRLALSRIARAIGRPVARPASPRRKGG